MAATYLTLVADELLNGPAPVELPRCLHIQRQTLDARHPGFWVVEFLDDDAPEELNAKQVELTLQRVGHERPRVADRKETTF